MALSRRYALSYDVKFPRSQVWEVLAQTDRLNRQIGLAPVSYGDSTNDEFGIYRPAHAQLAGMPMQWREYLFQWEQNKRYTIVRRYSKGPLASFEGGLELEKLGENSTRLTLWLRIEGRGHAGRLLVPLIAQRLLRRSSRYCKDAFLADNPSPRPHAPPPHNRQWNSGALERGIARLCKMPVEEEYALELQRFITTAGEDEVTEL